MPSAPTSSFDWFIDIVDDTGLLFVANPETLRLYVGEYHAEEELTQAMVASMEAGQLIAWQTGRPWPYKLRLTDQPPPRPPVCSSSRFLFYVSQDLAAGSLADLLPAVQFRHEPVQGARLSLPLGTYAVWVHRMTADPTLNVPEENFNFHALPSTPAHFHVQFHAVPHRDAWNSVGALPDLRLPVAGA